MEVSKRENIITSWFAWHFFQMPRFLYSVWENYFSFILEYFSLPLLLATLLSPWRKYYWAYSKKINIGEYIANFISNCFSRLLGAILRIILIVMGIVAVVFVVAAGALCIILWLALPFIVLALIFLAFRV